MTLFESNLQGIKNRRDPEIGGLRQLPEAHRQE
jgi:hypothetical protein